MMRMVCLYALRYEKHSSNDVGGLLNMLSRRGVSEQYKKVHSYVLLYCCFPGLFSEDRERKIKWSWYVLEAQDCHRVKDPWERGWGYPFRTAA